MPVEVALSEINAQAATHELAPDLVDFVRASAWPEAVQTAFLIFAGSSAEHSSKLNTLFTSIHLRTTCVPLMIYHEAHEQFYVIYTDQTRTPEEPGEPGSVLAYIRAYGYDDDVLNSDCYGQLSCSSCSIEVHAGSLENETPRDEEYDMLDIDTEKPATRFTRLSCQAVIGRTPLIVTIRKPACMG